MHIPARVDNTMLQALAAPTDTHEVHVIVRRIANHAPYTLRGRKRQYIVSRDHERSAHILKVPMSVWMHGISKGTVIDNDSICYDLQSSRTSLKSPLTFEVHEVRPAPVKPDAPAAPQEEPAPDAPAPSGNAARQAAYRARKRQEREDAEKLQTV